MVEHYPQILTSQEKATTTIVALVVIAAAAVVFIWMDNVDSTFLIRHHDSCKSLYRITYLIVTLCLLTITGIAAEERKLHEAGSRRTVQHAYHPDDSQGSEAMSLVSERQYPKVDRLDLPHSSSEDEVRHADKLTDMQMLTSCSGTLLL